LEECGFHRIWVRDMFVAPWELWSAVTVVALSTKTVRVGIDVTNPYTRSPVVTAHASITVDNLSGGRLDLGLGKGIGSHLKMMGIVPYEHGLEEAVRFIRHMLTGKKARLKGEAFSVLDVQLPVRAVQENLPVWIAAVDEEEFRMAGRLADGVLTISARRPFLESAMRLVGRTVPLATWLPYSTSRDELASYLDELIPNFPDYVLDAMGLEKDLVSREELLDSFAVCGPRDLADKTRRLEAIGVTEIILEYFALEDLQGLRSILRD